MAQQRKFLKNADGNVMVITALSILVLVGLSGFGIDLGRQQMVRLQIQQASDAAALAAASLEGASNAERYAAAQRYFNLNIPLEFFGISRPSPTISITNGEVNVDAEGGTRNVFTQLLGSSSSQAGGGSGVGVGESRQNSDYDVVMVVDESGSTSATAPGSRDSRMDVQKDSIQDMLDVIMPTGSTGGTIRFGVVGYSGSLKTLGGLTNDAGTARSYVNRLSPCYQNYDHIGLAAGANMISGEWTNGAAPASQCNSTDASVAVPPAVNNRADGHKLSSTKHVVFLTDGFIMIEPPLCGGGRGGPCDASYRVFLEACSRVKSTGAILHTISFASRGHQDETTLRNCASTDEKGQPRYYYAPDAKTLQSILQNVGSAIRKIKINR